MFSMSSMSNMPSENRTVVSVIDDYANSQPDRLYASIPIDEEDLGKGYKDFTYRQVASAIDAASLWLDKTLGKSDGSFETFIYVGTRDLRYAFMAMAATKTGRAALFPSLFGSMESHVFLANKTRAQHILYADELEGLAHEVHANYPQAPCIRVPLEAEWLNDHNDSTPHYPYTKTYEEAERDPVFIVHTSGTTGMPKPVVWTNGHMSSLAGVFSLPPVDGRRVNLGRIRSGRLYNALPAFHVVGLLFSLVFVVYTDVVAVYGPAAKAPTKEIAETVLDHSGATGGIFAPFLLEILSREPRALAKVKKLEQAYYGGAPLSQEVGEELNRVPGLDLINAFGNTEGGGWLTLEPDPEDWQYFIFHPHMGIKMEQQGEDDMYECVIHRTPQSEKYTNFWRTFPDETVIHTKDLFSPHPTKKDVWRYRCRLDDLILLTGEIKLYCRTIEEAVESHPDVSGVLVGGDRRYRPFMLIELVEDGKRGLEEILDGVWDTVLKENKRNAPSASILRNMTIVMNGDKGLVRSPKGSVERRKTFSKYEDEIEGLYKEHTVNVEDVKRHDSGQDIVGTRIPGTEDIDRTL